MLLLLAFLIPAILFFLSQQRILQVISPENREMSPGSVWFQIIPVCRYDLAIYCRCPDFPFSLKGICI